MSLHEKRTRRLTWSCVLVTLVLGLLGAPGLGHAESSGAGLRETLSSLAVGVSDRPWGPVIATLVFALAGALFVPVNLLAAVALAVFGSWPGMAVAWLGGLLGAMLSHACGWHLGAHALVLIPERVRQRLLVLAGRRGFGAVVLMRILPVGNFGVFNLLAGAFKLPRRAFVLGNMLGLLPGLLGLGLMGSRLSAVLRRPGVVNLLLLGLALALLAAGMLFLRRRYRTVLQVPPE